ncbi:uncharacterized protein LOC135812186 [Sycon ciliatum]|uniref:uncharacterized protein LOC135812186 n=1 Tax=Sycon ciliatum TaxID=27933 RepID=UPI0031F6A6FF
MFTMSMISSSMLPASLILASSLCLLPIHPANAANCKVREGTSCVCDMDDGSGFISLMEISNNNGPSSKPFFTNVKSGRYEYSFNPCTAFTETKCSNNVAVCQQRSSVCGRQQTQFDMTQNPPTITYGNGACVQKPAPAPDTTQPPQPQPTSREPAPPSAGPTSPHRHPEHNSISLGTIMDVCLLLLIVTYLVAGTAFMYLHRGARGKKALPNLAFWLMVPELIKEGALFVVVKVKSLRGLQRTGYSEL